MHLLTQTMIFAQSAMDIELEMARLQRNFTFLSYGLIVAWVVVVLYVLMMVGREKKLQREIASLRTMLEDRQHS
jgi:membrane protein CcdC involved in cytochrome C biogenesis